MPKITIESLKTFVLLEFPFHSIGQQYLITFRISLEVVNNAFATF